MHNCFKNPHDMTTQTAAILKCSSFKSFRHGCSKIQTADLLNAIAPEVLDSVEVA